MVLTTASDLSLRRDIDLPKAGRPEVARPDTRKMPPPISLPQSFGPRFGEDGAVDLAVLAPFATDRHNYPVSLTTARHP